MPDRRAHRGLDPEDPGLFNAHTWTSLRAAVSDLSFLFGRKYAVDSALKLVGDRYQLRARQRAAVLRSACAQERMAARASRELAPEALSGQTLCLDGFNVLTSLEVALSGGVLLIGRDGALRDIAGVHGSYRQVEETLPALELIRQVTTALGVARCEWYFDQPVSNSGRLCARVRALAEQAALPWEASVVPDPDRLLMQSAQVVASADARILDADVRWFNLARCVVERCVPAACLIDLSG
jgi:hypothetical protein